MRPTRAAVAAFFVLAFVSALAPQAAAVNTFTISCGVGVGATISSPGTWRLAKAVSNCNDSLVAIEIDSSDVTVDLAHYVVGGHFPIVSGTHGIATAPSIANVRVINGTLNNWATGIDFSNVDGGTLTNLVVQVADTGVLPGRGAHISSSVIDTIAARAIDDTGGGSATIEHNVITEAGDDAVTVVGSDTIIDNTIGGNTGNGITSTGAATTISGNRILGNTGRAIIAENADTVSRNVVVGNGLGISVGSSNLVTRNTVVANGSGISGSPAGLPPNTFTKNTIRGNHSSGLLIGQNDIATSNKSTANYGDGIQVAPNSTVFSGTVTKNIASGNFGDGIEIQTSADANALISHNTADGNGFSGIADPSGSPPKQALSNEAHGNVSATQCDMNLCTSKTVSHPFTIDCTQATGAKILHSGTFRLAKAVRNCASSTTMIEVDAPNVTLDLGQTLMDGAGTTCGAGISTTNPNVKIIGGVIHDCAIGLDIEQPRAIITGTSASNGTGNGIQFGVAKPDKAKLSSVLFDGFQINGIVGSHMTVRRSFATFNGITGIGGGFVHLSDSAMVANTHQGANMTFSTITHNLIAANLSNGLDNGDSSTVSGNTVVGNSLNGVTGSGHNHLTKNLSDGNGGIGIHELDSNVISKNVARGNGSVGILVGDKNKVRSNLAEGSGLSGIEADPADGTVNGTTITRNTADGNGSDGIKLLDPSDAPPTVHVTHNVADGNGLQGINTAVGAQPSGAHTNEASGNAGAPPECDANLC
jgi:parallel beta-helix repeat protein